MKFEDLKNLYLKKKEQLGGDTYKHISNLLKEAKEIHKQDRKAQGQHLFNWAASRGIDMDDILRNQIGAGFEEGDDAFDAILGLMSMIEVLLGYRSDGAPSDAVVRDIEGWIFGQV